MTSLDTPATPDGFGARVRSAVFWRSGSQIAAQIVMWAATIIVVRLLDPHDYGLFAMTQVVLVVFNFLNGDSFAASLIQEEDVSERRIAQVFGMLLVSNLVLAGVQILAAPLAAAYFRQPIVADMLRVQALLYLTTPFISLPSALLARRLDFRAQAKANIAAALAGAVTALGCAWSGLGVWTLVFTPLVLFSVRAIGLTIAAKLLVRPVFNFRDAGGVVRFGGALMLSQFFWIVQSQSDIFIAGRTFTPHDLGLYAEALFLTLIFTSKFVPPLNEVAFPAYSELAKSGGAVGDAFATSLRLTAFVAMPLFLGMAVVAEPLIETLFGAKWLDMAPLVHLLALAMPFFALQIIFSPATNARGRPGILVRTSGANALIMATGFAIGAQYGTRGLVTAWLIGAPVMLAFTVAVSRTVIGIGFRQLLAAVLPSATAAAAMAGVVLAFATQTRTLAAPVELAVLVLVGAISYFALLYRFDRDALGDTYTLVTKRKLPQRAAA